MSDVKVKRPKTIECKVKKRFKFGEKSPTRKRDEVVKLSQSEYDFASSNGCLY